MERYDLGIAGATTTTKSVRWNPRDRGRTERVAVLRRDSSTEAEPNETRKNIVDVRLMMWVDMEPSIHSGSGAA